MAELFKDLAKFKDRITFDVDQTAMPIKLLQTLKRTRDLIEIRIKPSSSGKWHVVAYYKTIKSKRTHNKLRRKFDDKLRRHYDRREKPKQILFNKKAK